MGSRNLLPDNLPGNPEAADWGPHLGNHWSRLQKQKLIQRDSRGSRQCLSLPDMFTLNIFYLLGYSVFELSSPQMESESESHSVVSDSLRPHGLYSPWNSPGQNTGVGSLSLLQFIFPAQGSNPGLLHCRWILYQLNHKRNHKWKVHLKCKNSMC